MKKPTFIMVGADHAPMGDPVPYTRMRVQVGGVEHVLALHKDTHACWRVSCPKCGALVLRVAGSYKGIRVSSAGYTQREILALAEQQVGALAERIGHERFNAVLASGKTRETA